MRHRPGLVALPGILFGLFIGLLAALLPAHAARVEAFSPQGTVADVRQISVRFDSPVVPAGDPRRPAPFTLQCNGQTPPGDGRWASERLWLYDLRAPLPPGQRCTLQPAPGWQPLQGRFEGPAESRFETVPLAVRSVRPYPGGL